MTDESREALSGFVERAERIARSGYWKKVMEQGGTRVSFSWTRGVGGYYSDNLPDEEARDALLLTARMFVQNNDPVSFGNMAKLEGDPGVSEEWKERVRDVRAALNGYLDSPSAFDIDGKRYTHREIFNVFLYGGLAHTDPKLAPVYRLWRDNKLAFPMINWEFHQVVVELLQAVDYLAHYSKMELNGEQIPPIPSEEDPEAQ